MKKLLLLLSCITILSSCTDTYDECVYKKIKDCDGNKACTVAARNLCNKSFPYELGDWKQVDWNDIDNADGKIQISSVTHGTKICFNNASLGIEEECQSWDYSFGLTSPRYSQFDIAKQISENHKFLNAAQDNFLDGTTYRVYRAKRYRKGEKP